MVLWKALHFQDKLETLMHSQSKPALMILLHSTDKCTECKGFHEEPQCAAVCPVECCVPDE